MPKLPPSDNLDPRLAELLRTLGLDADRVQIMSLDDIGRTNTVERPPKSGNVVRGPWPPRGTTDGGTLGLRGAPSHRHTFERTPMTDVLKVLQASERQVMNQRHDACIVITMNADDPDNTAVILHSGLNKHEVIGVLEGVKHDVMVRDDGLPIDAA